MSRYAELSNLSVSVQQIENCAFSRWYHLFHGSTPKAEIIKPVPAGFMEYLEQDGIRLPNDSNFKQSSYFQDVQETEDNEYSDWEQEENENENENGGEVMASQHDTKTEVTSMFPDLHQKLKGLFQEMGPLTPKLTWSSPKDATWILANNTLKCHEVNDVYLLLKASSHITHDLDRAFDECFDRETLKETPQTFGHELILRKWFDINPALEFRVFVKNSKIIGVSQRDLNFYDYLLPLVDTFKELIDEFIHEQVSQKFPDPSYVCDVYIPRPFQKVWLIDFNPFCRKTDSLMFSWHELITANENDIEDDYEMRLVKENNVARFAGKEHSESQVPKDVADAITNPDAIKELASKWSELLKMQQAEDSSEEE
ncbi:LAME_0B06414g1_1 [Lachancea meyersii CBS 8951]|uniref:Translation initiation factor eIF2 assembly protein n=1 Tax=Lachancea meyersii CBS 8951 TaxID=1266667 RepID=A0A1G4IWJ7_9SACH|nr:LAME_0B06414g1_1 [Lachancea meyersii CBS 8951]